MRRANLFWGTALIVVGVLLVLQTQGIIGNVMPYLWPLALILAGGWIILGVYLPAPSASEEGTFLVPLGEAKTARFKFSHGAGQIEITGGAPAGQALAGSSAVAMNQENWLDGDRLEVKVEAGPSFVPFLGPSHGIWHFQLTQEIPSTLLVEAGASSVNLNLTDVPVRHVELKTGASGSSIVMPEKGVSLLDVEAGAASVRVVVPAQTEARIRVREGVTSLSIDTTRFPRLESGHYQSSGFETAANRTEINIEAGLGTVTIV